jgi:hypothetical protein
MAVKSSTVTAGATASVLAVGEPGNGNIAKKVAIIPAAAILIGGPDAQTFPVSTAGISLDLISGDTVYVVRSGGADVAVEVLEVSI